MHKKLINILLLLSVINFSCKKDSAPKIDVTNVTETDMSGNNISQPDITDWTQDVAWTADEMALFETPAAAQLANTEKAVITIGPAFPNPSALRIILFSTTTKIALEQIVITDDMLNIKDRFFALTQDNMPSLFALELKDATYANNTNYRVYYGFYSAADGLYFKGHGDIKIKK